MMKRKKLILLLISTSLLSFTACGNTNTTASTDIPAEVLPSIEESVDTAVSMESTSSQYSVTLNTQDIIYQTPDRNATLASITLQTPFLAGNDTTAIVSINEAFLASYDNAIALLDGTDSSKEGDLLYKLPQAAYERYSMIDTPDDLSYTVNQEYAIQRIDDMIFSSIEVVYAYIGGAHGSSIQSGVNYNMQTGEVLTLAELSDDYDAFLTYCTEQLLTLADARQAKEAVFFEGYQDNISQIITDDTFYFSKEGLCFISQEYMLQPYAAGTITLCIPYENLKGYLKDEYFPSDTSWDFEVTSTENEPITYTFQADFADEVAAPMLDSFLSWTGLLYFYGADIQLDSLTTEAAFSMAGFAILSDGAYEEAWYDDSIGGYAIPASLTNTYTENYFGKTYDISSFQSSEQYPMVSTTENEELLVQVGDWGLVAPKYRIADTIQNKDGSYTVSVNYFSYDYEFDEESDTLAAASYVFTPDSNSTFGYVISDMQFTQISTVG